MGSGAKPASWWVMLGGTIGVIVLDFAPWVSLPFGITLSGADASWGVVPALTGVAALIAVLCDAGQRRDSAVIVALVFAGISLGVTILWAIDVFGSASQQEILGASALAFVHPAWGLYFEIAAGIAAVVACCVILSARRRADRQFGWARPAVAAQPAAPVAAGWFPDPYRQAAYRWWDGYQWTGHIR